MELGGWGQIGFLGKARRIPVTSSLAESLLEALENHTPDILITDEISNQAEVDAIRTTIERGVLVIASAHGENLLSIIRNPILNDLLGGVQAVTLGDERARLEQHGRKTLLERTREPSFTLVAELENYRDAINIMGDTGIDDCDLASLIDQALLW